MRAVVSLVVVLLIVFGIYTLYLKRVTPAGPGSTPVQTISLTGVQNDLLAIAQAERIYFTQNGAYASLDQLISSGSLSMAQSGRDGYTYTVETSPSGFTITAQHPPGSGAVHYPAMAIDQTMQIRQLD
jgi:Tfp pilus assembly protein PilE